MVLLYKDPRGENVFAPVSASSRHYSLSGAREEDEVEKWRRRAKELETVLALSQVGSGLEVQNLLTSILHIQSL